MDVFEKTKIIKEICITIDSYLKAEKEFNWTIDGKTGDYGLLSDREKIVTEKLDAELRQQGEYLEKLLSDNNFGIHPVDLINIYDENKLKAVQMLEGYCNDKR